MYLEKMNTSLTSRVMTFLWFQQPLKILIVLKQLTPLWI